MFLKSFLETAEQHFFVGFKVHIYVFTDRSNEVPRVRMAAGRQVRREERKRDASRPVPPLKPPGLTPGPTPCPPQLTVRSVPGSERWQEISARRMELIQTLIEEQPPTPRGYIFCLDVDSRFHGRWGSESLGALVAVTHPGQWAAPPSHQPASRGVRCL